jgi:hypothetical protein
MSTWQYFVDQSDGLLKEVGVGQEWKPRTMVERLPIFSLQNQKLRRSWTLYWRGCFGQGIKWDAPSSLSMGLNFGLGLWRLQTMAVGVHGQRFGLWAWLLEASHYARLKAPIPIFY